MKARFVTQYACKLLIVATTTSPGTHSKLKMGTVSKKRTPPLPVPSAFSAVSNAPGVAGVVLGCNGVPSSPFLLASKPILPGLEGLGELGIPGLLVIFSAVEAMLTVMDRDCCFTILPSERP